jgi:hypothetical protein
MRRRKNCRASPTYGFHGDLVFSRMRVEQYLVARSSRELDAHKNNRMNNVDLAMLKTRDSRPY